MKKVVVNGTFDVIHPGHLALLNYARSLGDFLIVAIDTDERVRQLKGQYRPINNQQERKILLENLKSVDQVEIFGSDLELVSIIRQCDIMVKGSDYRGKSVIGEANCHVIYFERIDDYSSTAKIQDIIDRGQRH
jgi:D-beta-D-heptose 7-phosphate kinase/D-beta-D-heptose 1-phosphate adenosyltransferase